MTETDERVERLAEILSWAGGEMTRYGPDASPDHNRWSWHGDGHGEWWWDHFRDIAATVLAAPEFAEVLRAERAAALREAADEMGRRIADFPARGSHISARWAEVWLRDVWAAGLDQQDVEDHPEDA